MCYSTEHEQLSVKLSRDSSIFVPKLISSILCAIVCQWTRQQHPDCRHTCLSRSQPAAASHLESYVSHTSVCPRGLLRVRFGHVIAQNDIPRSTYYFRYSLLGRRFPSRHVTSQRCLQQSLYIPLLGRILSPRLG